MVARFILSLLLAIPVGLIAQQQLHIPRNIQQAYTQQTRSETGLPGKNYWQNTASYNLQVQFDPLSRYLQGTEEITYQNNSPDTLNVLWFKLYPNLYKKGTPVLVNIAVEDLSDGLVIDTISIEGKTGMVPKTDGTNMTASIDPLLPGKSIHLSIHYHYILNKGSHNRTGEIDLGADFIAYFFPRIAVYDDVDGWNKNPYLGPQEFYNDFCQFDVNISVPRGFAVWATGDLKNGDQALDPHIYERLQYAETHDVITNVIDSADLANAAVTANKPTNTWHFTADNVTDFAFAVSDHYLWKSTSLVVDPATNRRTRVDVAFNPIHSDFYEVIDFARKTVESMSYRFPAWPFPYPHITVFDGLDQMEYPMMVNDNPLDNRTDAITLTDHEIFHTIFPFYMGINETKYGWMDEGWATMGEWLISPMIDPSIEDDYGVKPYEKAAGKEIDLPIHTLTTQTFGEALFLNSYPKPALGYLYIKDLLGDSLFKKALHYYIEQWHGKHPIPYDFFNCINVGSGQNLNWFFKKWFFDSGVPDLAIQQVKKRKNNYSVEISSPGSKPVPIDLVVHYIDGSHQTIHRNISCWQQGNTSVTVSFNPEMRVKKFTLGSTYIPDTNRQNNTYIVE